MKKTTQLMEELNGSDDINSFLSNNKDSLDRQDFARYLCELVKKKKMTKIEVIRISQLNQIYGYQIFAGARLPSKDKIIAIALAMKLDIDELSVKATTEERLGFTGREEGIAAHAVVLLMTI